MPDTVIYFQDVTSLSLKITQLAEASGKGGRSVSPEWAAHAALIRPALREREGTKRYSI